MSERGFRFTPLFVVFNFCIAALSFLGFLSFALILIYGLFFSGDTGEDLFAGVAGCSIFMGVSFAFFGLYLFAAIGLLRKAAWGYYCHLVGAVFPALTCLGLAYTIPVIIFTLQPDFQAEFFSS